MGRSLRVVVSIVLLAGSATAAPPPAADPGGSHAPGTLVLSAASSDIDPGPPPALFANAWLYPAHYPGTGPLAAPLFVPLPRFTLSLPPLLGVQPFLTATLTRNPLYSWATTSAGFTLGQGPLRAGTRFSLTRQAQHDLWLTNMSFVRFVQPRFDVGAEAVTRYALVASKRASERLYLGSLGVRPAADAPTLRVNASVNPKTARSFSSASLFGVF